MSSGRTYVLILFFWAILTLVTPVLIRLSASAKLQHGFEGEKQVGMKLLLPRRALVMETRSLALAFAPGPAPLSDERDGMKLKFNRTRIKIHEPSESELRAFEV